MNLHQQSGLDYIDSLMTLLMYLFIIMMQIQISSTFIVLLIVLLITLQVMRIITLNYRHNRINNRLAISGFLLLLSTYYMNIITITSVSSAQKEFRALLLFAVGVIVFSWENRIISSKIVIFLFWSSSLLSFLGVIQYIYNIDIPLFNPLIYGRLQGGFNGPNELANTNSIIVGLTLSYHIIAKKIPFLMLGIVPIALGVVFSWSRGGFLLLSLAITGGIVIALFKNKKVDRFSTIMKRIGIVLLGLFVGIVFIYLYLPQLKSVREGSTDRDYILRYTIEMLKESPWFGHGLGFTASSSYIINDTPHNEYFLFAINGGIFALSILIILFWNMMRTTWDKGKNYLVLPLLLFFVAEIFFNNLIRYKLVVIVYIIIILINSKEYDPSSVV